MSWIIRSKQAYMRIRTHLINEIEWAADKSLSVSNHVTELIKTYLNSAANIVANKLGKIGDDINHAIKGSEEATSDLPQQKIGIIAIRQWFGNLISDLFEIGTATIKSISSTLSGAIGLVGSILPSLLSGSVLMFGGIICFRPNLIKKGFVDILLFGLGDGLNEILAGTIGSLVLISLKAVSAVQGFLWLEEPKRKLSAPEIELAKEIFQESIPTDLIKIIPGRSGTFGFFSPRSAVTFAEDIYLKYRNGPALFTHELIHIWQYKRYGSRYIYDSICEQVFTRDHGYDWKSRFSKNGILRPCMRDVEAFPRLFEDIFTSGILENPHNGTALGGNGCFFRQTPQNAKQHQARLILNGHDYTKLAHDAVTKVRERVDHFPSCSIM